MGRCYIITLRESTRRRGRRSVFSNARLVMPREGGASSTPRLLDSITAISGILGRPPSRAMTTEYDYAISRRVRPRFALELAPSEREGAGKTGCTLHPRSRVQFAHKKTHTSIQVQRRHPAFPAQWFTAYFVLSPVNGFVATVAAQILSARLDASTAASGPHDFAVRVGQPRQSWLPRPPHPTARS
jgi:hypothetical protein